MLFFNTLSKTSSIFLRLLRSSTLWRAHCVWVSKLPMAFGSHLWLHAFNAVAWIDIKLWPGVWFGSNSEFRSQPQPLMLAPESQPETPLQPSLHFQCRHALPKPNSHDFGPGRSSISLPLCLHSLQFPVLQRTTVARAGHIPLAKCAPVGTGLFFSSS